MPAPSRSLAGLLLLLLPLAACGPDEARQEAVKTVTPSGAGRRSQPARLVQRMGSTELTVVYNRPSARGRPLFGGIVPFDSLWNPGADEATRLEVNEPVTVAGRPLPAGRYSLWAVPGREAWTIAFNRAWDVNHLTYRPDRDALRLRVRPQQGEYLESLAFYFPYAEPDSALLVLHWGRTVLPLPLRRP